MENLFNFLSIFCQNKFALKIDKIAVKKKSVKRKNKMGILLTFHYKTQHLRIPHISQTSKSQIDDLNTFTIIGKKMSFKFKSFPEANIQAQMSHWRILPNY